MNEESIKPRKAIIPFYQRRVVLRRIGFPAHMAYHYFKFFDTEDG